MAARLAQALVREGVDCVLDPELVEGDPFWRETIARHFPDCDLMVGLHSAFALASPWVEQEQRAFQGRKLWVAVDSGIAAEPLSTIATDKLIPLEQALSTIQATLPHSCARFRRFGEVLASTLKTERVSRTREAQVKLENFRASLSGLSRLRLEIEGDVAQIDDEFMALRRLSGAASAFDTYLSVLPVTNSQYRAFRDAADYPVPPTWKRAEFRADDAPVTGINWFEAAAFAHWLGGSLPTEADWVAAAMGGDPSRFYATATGQIQDHLACFGRQFGATAPAQVVAYPPNAEGYYGMCGNTWDWCASPWGGHRVIRGGGCMDSAAFCATRSRYRNAPIDRDCSVGFRVKIELSVNRHK